MRYAEIPTAAATATEEEDDVEKTTLGRLGSGREVEFSSKRGGQAEHTSVVQCKGGPDENEAGQRPAAGETGMDRERASEELRRAAAVQEGRGRRGGEEVQGDQAADDRQTDEETGLPGPGLDPLQQQPQAGGTAETGVGGSREDQTEPGHIPAADESEERRSTVRRGRIDRVERSLQRQRAAADSEDIGAAQPAAARGEQHEEHIPEADA